MFSTHSSQTSRRVSFIRHGFMEMMPASPVAPVPLSPHAEVRQQQRGIRRDVLECLVAYGRREHDHAHCEIIYFDSKAIERVKREVGSQASQLASDHRDVYAVIDSDGRIVTTGHRYRRILRDKSQSSYRSRPRRSFSAVAAYRARTRSTVLQATDWVDAAE